MTKIGWKVKITDALITALSFSALHYFIFREFNVRTIFQAVTMGILFGFFFRRFLFKGSEKLAAALLKQIKVELEADEVLIKETGANHFRGVEAVGGKLVLTNKRLIFKSHKLNIQTHQQTFPINQISNLRESGLMSSVNNILTLEIGQNETHKFVVESPSEWIKEIPAIMSNS